MKKTLITLLAVLGLVATAPAQNYGYVNPHIRSNGSYVQGHYRTVPDGNFNNNWSTRGNVNPFTGQHGYRTEPQNRFFHFNGSSQRAW